MSTVLITGVSGQDGTYLAEQLIAKGHRVLGGVRDVSRARNALPLSLRGEVDLLEWDMSSLSLLKEVLAKTAPAEIYNLAAYTSGAAMFEDPIGMAEVNGLAVSRMLEAIRAVDPSIKFCQASSREIFGEALESPQTESTPANPRSPYGAAKLYADSMIRIYRRRYGMHACSAILYNHESPRRGTNFVTRKISRGAAAIKLGLAEKLYLGNLDTQRDWGFAGDYVRAMWLMMHADVPEDYVVATGEAHSVREFCELAFAHLDLNYLDYVKEDDASFRPSEPAPLVGSPIKARRDLGWEPEVTFRDLVRMMVDSDMRDLQSSI